MNPLVWPIIVTFIVLGVLAYLGLWKQWMRVPRGYGTYMGFSMLYIGLALGVGGLAVELGVVRTPFGTVVMGVAVLLLLVAIVGFWWLPSFLQPRWFRIWLAATRRSDGR
ncbi:hypothetical protein [Microbacterium hibisci]|uniref:hypothetical protein n=1 Tax=Microbacterium hibisci TaxID=2036000 RepID=UPI0019454F96|nr:hypothetical protein [Microbacterium hibisci]